MRKPFASVLTDARAEMNQHLGPIERRVLIMRDQGIRLEEINSGPPSSGVKTPL